MPSFVRTTRELVLEGYRGACLKKLESFGVSIGDQVRVLTDRGEIDGVLMPRYEFADEGHVVVKLRTGYNTGISVARIKEMKVLSKGVEPAFQLPHKPALVAGLPKVLILGTGGTIASRIDYRTGGVKPALTSEELYYLVPELSSIAEVETVALFNIYSENMTALRWSQLAARVGKAVEDGYDGVVITHGTDTLHYTASALSFALEDPPIPVVVVGSQRSSDRPSSDAASNLVGAVRLAARGNASGVFVVMHGGLSDDEVDVHMGVRVRKNHSSRRDAFESVNSRPVGHIGQELALVRGLPPRRKSADGFTCIPLFSDDVSILKLYPGFNPSLIGFLVKGGCRAIILEGTGLGHAPSSINKELKAAIASGVFVGMTSQTIWGSVRMTVYNTGRDLLRLGVVPLGDMLSETAMAKASWLVGRGLPPDQIASLMATNLRGEMGARRTVK
jgi:glutamyl-tRNA(Gln) amidotransferase subunit D